MGIGRGVKTSIQFYFGLALFLWGGRGYMEVPVPPTSRACGFIRRSRLLFFWRWEVYRLTSSSPAWCGVGFTRANAERQALQWAAALL